MRPLEGLIVLDLTRYIPGPFASQLLADMGARVITIEDTRGGDPGRHMEPRIDGVGFPYAAYHRGKESVAIDTRSPAGVALVHRLAARADVFVESFRPGTLSKAGLDAPALMRENPRLVYLSLSGYGQTGPLKDAPGHDMNFEAVAGILHLMGPAGSPPVIPGVPFADIAGGYKAAVSVLGALLARERTGRGAHLDIALQDAAYEANLLNLTRARAPEGAPERGADEIAGALPAYNVYRTLEGRWLALGSLEPKFWEGFVRVAARPDLLPFGFALGSEEAKAKVQAVVATRSLDAWVRDLTAVGVPASPVLTPGEALAHPYVDARLPDLRKPPAPPALGAHTRRVLRDLAGLAESEVDALAAQGVLHAAP